MMWLTRPALLAICIAAVLCASAVPVIAADKLAVLIVDGQNNHDFENSTPWVKKQLEMTGRFTVDVSRTPPGGPKAKPGQKAPEADSATKAAWAAWRPAFDKYQVVLINYNGEDWPAEVNAAFEKYVSSGGGVFILHAGNNPFANWPAFNEMIGLGWRNADFGKRVIVDDAGKVVIVPPGEGPGSGHGAQHAYKVTVRDGSHPVMQGLPAVWMHAKDELYQGQRGPAEHMHILATAFADPAGPGGPKSSGANEPLVWWIPYGKGKVFTCLLGHVGRAKPGEPTVLDAQRDTAVVAIITRGCEWAATDKVTIPLPTKLPTATDVELAPLD